MATSGSWDIPNPCHFEECPPEKECGPCDAGNIFKYPHKVPGVPVGRVTVPLVRVNGQMQDLPIGGFIGNQFVEPPSLSWNPDTGILGIGGRYVRLNLSKDGGFMNLADCKGLAINPCTPIMTCANFAEIIGASRGIDFKDPSNPFAGLTVVLANNSGLTLTNGGLKLDYNAICQALQDMGCVGNAPTPTPPTPDPTPPTPTPPDPTPPGPTPPSPTTENRYGIPGYDCYSDGGTTLENSIGTFTLTWTPNHFSPGPQGNVTISPAGPTRLYTGTPSAANYIGNAGASMSLTQFNNITMVSVNQECQSTPDPTPPGPTPDPDPTPPSETETQEVTVTQCVYTFEGPQYTVFSTMGQATIEWVPSSPGASLGIATVTSGAFAAYTTFLGPIVQSGSKRNPLGVSGVTPMTLGTFQSIEYITDLEECPQGD